MEDHAEVMLADMFCRLGKIYTIRTDLVELAMDVCIFIPRRAGNGRRFRGRMSHSIENTW